MNVASNNGWRNVAAWVMSAFIGAIFAFAAFPKIAHPAAFAEAVYRYHLLPDALINPFAVYLPWTEIVLAIALLLGTRFRKGALLLTIILLLVFIAAMGINMHRGVNIACGCFSVASSAESMSWLNIARNLGLIALAVTVWRWSREATA